MQFQNIALVVVAGLLGVLVGIVVSNQISGSGSMDDDVFAERVRESLITQPEILRDAFYALEDQQREAEMTALQDAITRNYDLIESAPAAFEAGNPNGDITIVEFFDYECGFCRRAQEPFQEMVEADGNIRVILYELPILGETSYRAALAALAADRQGLYMPFHDAAIASSERLTDDVILAIAIEVGMDIEQLQADMADPEIAARVQANMQLGDALTVNSTPTYIVGGVPSLGWNEERMQSLIAAARGQ